MSNNTTDEIKTWLKVALENEHLLNLSVKCLGNTEKGSGYMGDVIFVEVSGETANCPKNYNLVLKCSKKSQALREAIPVKAAFENEIHLYQKIIPAFIDFQKRRGIVDVFSGVPKCYGSFVSENMEVLVLENLKVDGHYLCDSKKPLPTDHFELILKEYGKWHAISAAMQDQDPKQFKEIVGGMKKVWKLFAKQTNAERFFQQPIEEVRDVLESSLDKNKIEKLKKFESEVASIIDHVINNKDHFSVITHGDCWSNNFMFKRQDESLKVAILDWQTATLYSPIADISYFIHACASKENLNKFDELLRIYYESFSSYVRLLGSDPDKIFSFSQFKEDFKLLGKYGIMIATLAIKVALSDKEESPDFAESVDNGFENTFSYKNRDTSLLKSRIQYIIEHVIEHNFI